jgi:hypothetical protein
MPIAHPFIYSLILWHHHDDRSATAEDRGRDQPCEHHISILVETLQMVNENALAGGVIP